MITPGNVSAGSKGMASRTPAMPGLREPGEHARQRSDTVRAPQPGEQDRGEGEQPIGLAGALAARASERYIDLHGLQVTRPALRRAPPRSQVMMM